jgi:hypothetical protein
MLAGAFKPTDGTACGTHPQRHVFLGQAASLAGIEELTKKAKFRSCILPGFHVSRNLLDPVPFGVTIADERFVGEFSHGV